MICRAALWKQVIFFWIMEHSVEHANYYINQPSLLLLAFSLWQLHPLRGKAELSSLVRRLCYRVCVCAELVDPHNHLLGNDFLLRVNSSSVCHWFRTCQIYEYSSFAQIASYFYCNNITAKYQTPGDRVHCPFIPPAQKGPLVCKDHPGSSRLCQKVVFSTAWTILGPEEGGRLYTGAEDRAY